MQKVACTTEDRFYETRFPGNQTLLSLKLFKTLLNGKDDCECTIN